MKLDSAQQQKLENLPSQNSKNFQSFVMEEESDLLVMDKENIFGNTRKHLSVMTEIVVIIIRFEF